MSLKAFLVNHKCTPETISALLKQGDEVEDFLGVTEQEFVAFGLKSLVAKRLVKVFSQQSSETSELTSRLSRLTVCEKKFTVNGGIQIPEGVYFVNPCDSNATGPNSLVSRIEQGQFILLQGRRGIGKTTRCFYAITHQLSSFHAVYLTLQGGICANGTIEEFWSSFADRFCHAAKWTAPELSEQLQPDAAGHLFNSKVSFLKMMEETPSNPYRYGKKIVIFLDEFDLLLSNDARVARGELLDTLRAIKQRRGEYALQSFIAVGPLSILAVAHDENVSPFNVKDIVTSPIFNLEDIQQLFADYSSSCGIQVEGSVVEDIYQRTKGHAGLVCFCGKQIAEVLAPGKTSITLGEWIRFAYYVLPLRLPLGWSTIGKLVSLLKNNPSYREFLMKNFLYNSRESVAFTQTEDRDLAATLAAEGALELTNRDDPLNNAFSIPCTLLRSILLSLVSGKKTDRPFEIPLFPQTDRLNVVRALTLGLPYFDQEVMRAVAGVSHKKNRAPGADAARDALVPSENCYHVELMFLLRNWLPQWNIYSEANVPGGYCDLVIETANGTRCLIELVAHQIDRLGKKKDRDDSVLGHVQRVETQYKQQLDCHDAWVINFTTRQPNKAIADLGYIWPTPGSSVHLVHVYHDLYWTISRVAYRNEADESTVVDVPLSSAPIVGG